MSHKAKPRLLGWLVLSLVATSVCASTRWRTTRLRPTFDRNCNGRPIDPVNITWFGRPSETNAEAIKDHVEDHSNLSDTITLGIQTVKESRPTAGATTRKRMSLKASRTRSTLV